MLYPTLTPENESKDFIDVFGGYNHNLRISDNEFFDMKNMSSSKYPLLSSRTKRGRMPSALIPPIGNMVGMLYKSAFYTVSYNKGTSAAPLHVYKDGVEIAQFYDVVREPVKRELIMMGAYLIIMPDKVYVNTVDLTDYGMIEAEASTGNTTTIQLCTEDGGTVNIDYAGKTAPENPTDGYIWLDTSNDSPMIKKYFAGSAMWAADVANYIKLTGEDLAADFKEGDGVNLSGITADTFTHLNGTTILRTKPDDNTLVLSARFEEVDGNYTFFDVEKIRVQSSSLELISSNAVTENQFEGKTFIIGGKKAVCVGNSVSELQKGWRISSSVMLTNKSNTLKSINQYQNIASSSAGSSARLFVQLADDENIVTPSSDGTPVMVGEQETVGKPRKMIQANSQDGYIILNNVDPFEVPAETTIYPLEYGDLAGQNKFTILFDRSITGANKDTTVLLEPDFTTTQNTPVTISRKMPKMDFVIESGNRLWGCRYGENNDGDIVNEIYASKSGNLGFKNWQYFEGGIATSSYAVSRGIDGPWTGAINYQGHPVFFKENYIETVYGSYPAQFQISSITARGVQNGSSKSLAIINEVLYYLSSEGVCTYNGSLPVNISYAFGDIRYHDGIAAGFNGKYYISMRDTSPVLMVYDTKRSLWHKEDNINIDSMCSVADDIYCTADGKKLSLLGGTADEVVDWSCESGYFGLSMPNSKYISRLNLRLALDKGANAVVSIQYDNSTVWQKLCNIIRKDISPFTLPIKPRRCDHFRLKIEGKGGFKLYSISKTISQGSDKT